MKSHWFSLSFVKPKSRIIVVLKNGSTAKALATFSDAASPLELVRLSN